MSRKVNPPIATLAHLNLPRALLEFLDQLWLRTGGSEDTIADVEVTQTGEDGGNRTYRRFRDEIDDMQGQLVEQKRTNAGLKQLVYALMDQVNQGNRRNRALEQKLNELIERVDSGV